MSAATAETPVVRPAPKPATPAARTGGRLRSLVRWAPLLGPLVSVALVWWGIDSGVLRSLETLQSFIAGLDVWGPLLFIVIVIASVVAPIDPFSTPVIAAPVLFGPVEGVIYSYIAIVIGSVLNFLVARRLGLPAIERIFSPAAVERFLGWTRHRRFTGVFALAIALPVAPDDLLCYVAGTTRMRWSTFVTIVLTCKPWALIAYSLGISSLLLAVLPW